MTLLARVQKYVGSGVTDTDGSVSNWLTEGAMSLINLLPVSKLLTIAVTATFTNTLSTLYKKILSISSGGYACTLIPEGRRTQAALSGSIHYATSDSPVYYHLGGNINVLPAGLTSTADYVQYPIVSSSSANIPNFPIEFEFIVVLYAAIQAVLLALYTKLSSIASITFDTITAPSAPAFIYTDAALGTYSSTTLAALGTAPTYVVPVFAGIYTNVDTALVTNVDIELGQAHLSKVSAQLTQWQTDIQNSVAKYKQDADNYQTAFNVALQNAQLAQQRILQTAVDTKDINLQNEAQELNKQIAEYSAKISKYGNDVQLAVQKFTSQVQGKVSEVQAINQQYAMLKSEYNQALQLQLGVTNG